MRVAILETDTPSDSVYSKYGRYGQIFENMLKNAGFNGECRFYNVVNGEYPVESENIDAYLITGSKHNCYDNDKWIVDLVEFVKNTKDKPFIGICYGHQIVARALGAKTGPHPDNEWELSVVPMKMTNLAKQVFNTAKDQDTISIMQMHRDIVHELPRDTELLASNENCKVQGFYKKNKYWCVQGHPEFDSFIINEIVKSRKEGGIFSEELANDALNRSNNQVDSDVLAKSIVEFLNQSVCT